MMKIRGVVDTERVRRLNSLCKHHENEIAECEARIEQLRGLIANAKRRMNG